MLTAILIAAALSAEAPQSVSVIARSVPAAEVRPAGGPEAEAGEARPAGGPEAEEAETRRICRYERATGSNFRQRVCRDVPRVQYQDQDVRQFMRDHQRWDPLPSG